MARNYCAEATADGSDLPIRTTRDPLDFTRTFQSAPKESPCASPFAPHANEQAVSQDR